MFFYLSKIIWFLVNPGNMFLIIMTIGIILLLTRWHKAGRRVLIAMLFVSVFISTVPFSIPMLNYLENRFPVVTVLPEYVDGIIVAGGVVSLVISHLRGKASVNGNVERLLGLIDLGNQYPNAKIIFSAGAGDPFKPELKEAHYIKPLLDRMGFDSRRVILEDKSRNTIENAKFSFEIINPKPTEKWMLVTSAFHMPRAMGKSVV